VVVTCRAKLNLTFEVLGRRPDGYHEVRSLMHPVALCDRLEITWQPSGVTLEVVGIPVPAGRDNLCVRAAEAYRDLAGNLPGVHLRLAKCIPPEGGLGGGSADAAGVIAGLSHLLGRVPRERGATLAASLGSDVPFSLGGAPALAAGRGEVLSPVSPADFWVVIAQPGFGVSTRDAYGLLTPQDWTDGATTAAAADDLRRGAVHDLQAVNAFWRGLRARHPELERVRAALRDGGCTVTGLTGSGSCLFGLASCEAAAAAAEEAVAAVAAWSWHGPSAAAPLVVA